MKLFNRGEFDKRSRELTPVKELAVEKVSTGSKKIDDFLSGGLPTGFVTHVYGPPGSGKTNFCISVGSEAAKLGKKVLFVDTEGGFSVERLDQVCKGKNRDKFFVKQPNDFGEQGSVIRGLNRCLDDSFGLVVVDSIVSLYRLQVTSERKQVLDLSRELGKELARLSVLAREKKLCIIICNQVYSSFDGKDEIVPVGGDVLVYWSKIILELVKGKVDGERKATIRKHPSEAEGKSIKFRITSTGLA